MQKSKVAPPYYVHPSSFVEQDVKIGKATKVWYFCHISTGAVIGSNCNLGQNVFVDRDVRIGNCVKIQNNVSVYRGVTLEDGVFCGPSCVFTNVINPRSRIDRKHEIKKTLVKKNATVGANATVVCGVTIGTSAFIGAGAVVTRDVPDHALVTGSPARTAGWMCECGSRLEFVEDNAACPDCGTRYLRRDGRVSRQA